MGNKSVAFVKGVLTAMKTNPSIVPAAFLFNEFEKDYQLYLDLQFVLSLLRPLVEGIEDTMLAVGNELMRQGISGYKIIAGAAKTNSALDSIASELGYRFKRGRRAKPEVFTLQPRQTLTLNGIVPRRLLRTLNDSALTLYRGESATGKSKLVGGKSQIVIPVGWTHITVFNNHQTDLAIFSAIQK